MDTETTGLGPQDQIVEIAIIDSYGSVLLNTLIKPTIPIPLAATEIHGISNEDTANAPSLADVLPEILAILKDRTIIIYNANYDLRLLKQSAKAHNLTVDLSEKVYCAMEMYAEFYGDWNDYHQSYQWKKLEVAAKQCGIEIPHNLHRAITDAELTRQLTLFIAKILK